MALMTVIASPLSGRIVGRRGPRLPLVIAGVCLVTGVRDADRHRRRRPRSRWLIAAYVVFGLGFGFVNAPITNAAVSGMPRAQAGVAAAIATTSRQVGQTLGVAVVGAIVTSQRGRVGARGPVVGEPPGLVDAHGLRRASCSLLGLVATTGRANESARRTAAELNPEALAA